MTPNETQSPLDAARKLAPMVRSCADETEAERELPRPLFEALADAGFFHLAVPRSLGGAGPDLPPSIKVSEELGKADPTPAWAITQAAISARYAPGFPPAAPAPIW